MHKERQAVFDIGCNRRSTTNKGGGVCCMRCGMYCPSPSHHPHCTARSPSLSPHSPLPTLTHPQPALKLKLRSLSKLLELTLQCCRTRRPPAVLCCGRYHRRHGGLGGHLDGAGGAQLLILCTSLWGGEWQVNRRLGRCVCACVYVYNRCRCM